MIISTKDVVGKLTDSDHTKLRHGDGKTLLFWWSNEDGLDGQNM